MPDPVQSFCVNGQRCGPESGPYDWRRLSGGVARRVEAKSSKVHHDQRSGRWELRFCNVDFAKFDDLLLVVYLPWCLELWEYDVSLRARTATCGKRTDIRGHSIAVVAICRGGVLVDVWHTALRPRLVECASFVRNMPWNDPLISEQLEHIKAPTEHYKDAPFWGMSHVLRAAKFQHIARRVDGHITGHRVLDPLPHKAANGSALGVHQRPYDWLRIMGGTTQRVEAKSSTLLYDGCRQTWILRFSEVKFAELDVLILVVYAPWGLDFWEYDVPSRIGVSTAGTRTEVLGCVIQFFGKSREGCPRTSWDLNIRPRLTVAAKHVAQLDWDSPLLTFSNESGCVDTRRPSSPVQGSLEQA